MTTFMPGLISKRVLFLIGLVCAAPIFNNSAALESKAREAKNSLGNDLFERTNVVRLSISVPPAGLRALERASWGDRGQNSRPEAKATITEGTTVYKDVAIHLKGSAGSFRQINDKPGLTLNFDKYMPKQTFHGLEKLSLNNSVQDSTFIEEKICREMFEAAGVPVPRSDYALVTLNGQKLGLYVLVEGYNKQFLRRYFKNTGGNLYDGGFCREITENLNVNSGDKPNDRTDLRRLASAAAAARQNNSLTELSQVLDLDRFLTMVAMEVIQCHWDGYSMNRNNYRVYHDLESGKMIFMPHGLDQMFGTGDRGSPASPILPQMNGFVASAVLGTAEGRSRYLQRLAELRTNVFNVEAITNRVRQLEERIRPYISENTYSRRRSSVASLCDNIVARAENLDRQLGDPPKPAAFVNGIVRLTGWREHDVNGAGNFDISSSKDGKKLLHVTASGQTSASSWRTRLLLTSGRYIFEGYSRTRGAGSGSESGATLRISGTRRGAVLNGDSQWTMLSFPFEVPEASRDIELICELKGASGEAWFDTTSLKVRRAE